MLQPGRNTKNNNKQQKKKSKFDSWTNDQKERARSTVLSIHALFPQQTPDDILRIFIQEEQDETSTISRLIMIQEEEEERMMKENSSSASTQQPPENIPTTTTDDNTTTVITTDDDDGDHQIISSEVTLINSDDEDYNEEIAMDDEEDYNEEEEEIEVEVDAEEEEPIYNDPTEDENLFDYDDNEQIVLDVTDAYDYSEEDLQQQTQQSELRRAAIDPKYFIDLKKEEETLEYLWEQYKKKKQEYRILMDEEDILREQEQEVQHLKDLIQWKVSNKKGSTTGDDDAAILTMLKQYRWRSENIAHDYWERGPNYVFKTCGIVPPKEEEEESNSLICDECPACFCDNVPMTTSPNCGHSFCNVCWKSYLEVKIKENSGMGQTRINCMDCSNALTQDFIFSFFNNGNNGQEKLKRKFIENRIDTYVSDHFMVTRCPGSSNNSGGRGAGCKCVIKKTVDEPIHNVKCYCGERFCFQCGKETHFPATCQQFTDFKSKSSGMSEGASLSYIQSNTKYCPNCRKAIEKNGGCNHMTCSMCRHEFCWLCFGRWHSHNFETCKERLISSDSTSNSRLTKNETHQRNLYQHYIYYESKMNEHKQWLQRETFNHYLKNHIQQFKADIYMHTDVPYKHLFWVDEMLKKVKEAKRVLYGAYIYAFCVFNEELAEQTKQQQQQQGSGQTTTTTTKTHQLNSLLLMNKSSKEYKTKKERERCFLLFDTHLNNLEKAVSTLLQKVDFLTDNAWSDYLSDISKQKIYSEQYTMRPFLNAVSNQIEGLKAVIESVDMKSLM